MLITPLITPARAADNDGEIFTNKGGVRRHKHTSGIYLFVHIPQHLQIAKKYALWIGELYENISGGFNR